MGIEYMIFDDICLVLDIGLKMLGINVSFCMTIVHPSHGHLRISISCSDTAISDL